VTRYRFPQDRRFNVPSVLCLHRYPNPSSASSFGSELIAREAPMLAGHGSSLRPVTATGCSRTGTIAEQRMRLRTRMRPAPSLSTRALVANSLWITSATIATWHAQEGRVSTAAAATLDIFVWRRTWKTSTLPSSLESSESSLSSVRKDTTSTRSTPVGSVSGVTRSDIARPACVSAGGNDVTDRTGRVMLKRHSGIATPQCARVAMTTPSPKSSCPPRASGTAEPAAKRMDGRGESLGGDPS
jgi:hypothetical protein